MLIPGTDYEYLKYKGIYTLKNISVTSFTYIVSIVKTFTNVVLLTRVIEPGTTHTLLTGMLDGEYKIELVDADTSVMTISILNYETLLSKIVYNVKNIVCEDCQECKKCSRCDEHLDALISAQSYYQLNYSMYDSYMSNINATLASSVGDSTTVYMTDLKIKGKTIPEKLLSKLLGIHYLSFYYTDLSLARDVEEVEYINDFYKSNHILGCLRDLGINVASGEQVVDSNINVYFWQLSTSGDTINTVIPLLDNNFINAKAMYPLQEFETGKTISYNSISKVAFVLKQVTTTGFAIYDSLNNNVTDQFDMYYDANIKALLYVSKVNYSFSNVFFKIKNLII